MSHSPGVWKSETSVSTGRVKTSSRRQTSHRVLVMEGPQNSGGICFIRGLIPFRGGPPSSPKHFPKGLPPKIIALSIRISIYESGLPWWLRGKESACKVGDSGDVGLIPGSGRSPGGGNGNPLRYSGLETPMDRSLVGHSPWGRKESDTTEHSHTHTHEFGRDTLTPQHVLAFPPSFFPLSLFLFFLLSLSFSIQTYTFKYFDHSS